MYLSAVVAWVTFMTYFDLWPTTDVWCAWMHVLIMLVTPQNMLKQDAMWVTEPPAFVPVENYEAEADVECGRETVDDDDNAISLDFWEQVMLDVVCGTWGTPHKSNSYYYDGEQPTITEHCGPLIASAEGKSLVDAASPTKLDWRRLNRLTRFIVVDLNPTQYGDQQVKHNVRTLSALYHKEPTLAPLVAKWYGAPWFQAKTPLIKIRDQLIRTCPGLRHLQDNKAFECLGQHCGAPPTYVVSAAVPSTFRNWRDQELICARADDGWYFVRTVFDKTPRPNEVSGLLEPRVYFYVSLCLDKPWQWLTQSQDRRTQWRRDMAYLLEFKLDYLLDDLPERVDFEPTCSNQWLLLRLSD
jgi:hypothetical protein